MDLIKLIQVLLLGLLLVFGSWSLLCPLWRERSLRHPRAEAVLRTPVPFYLAPMIVGFMAALWVVAVIAQQRAGFFPEQFVLQGRPPVDVIGQYFTGRMKWLWTVLAAALLLAAWYFRPGRGAAPMPLAPIVVLLALLGLLLLLRLGPDLYRYSRREYLMTLVTKQVLFVSAGLVVMIVAAGRAGIWAIRQVARFPLQLALATLLLCFVTLFFGVERNQHRLWLNLGFFELQVTEIVKLVFALTAAAVLADFSRSGTGVEEARVPARAWLNLGAVLALMGMPAVMRDLGPLAQCVLVLALLLASMRKYGWALLVLALAAGGGAVSYALGWPATVRERVDIWLHPFSSVVDHIAQALWAISDGGWFGAGLSRGQAATIPEIHTDVIPALIAEELGFCGIAGVLLLYAGLARCGFAVARRAGDPFRVLAALALTVLPVSQALMIMCGTAGLIPLTGITLPLVSAGGSSMLTTFLGLGLLIACGRRPGPKAPVESQGPNETREESPAPPRQEQAHLEND